MLLLKEFSRELSDRLSICKSFLSILWKRRKIAWIGGFYNKAGWSEVTRTPDIAPNVCLNLQGAFYSSFLAFPLIRFCIFERYAVITHEEFSCLEFNMNRDTISWILRKIKYKRSLMEHLPRKICQNGIGYTLVGDYYTPTYSCWRKVASHWDLRPYAQSLFGAVPSSPV